LSVGAIDNHAATSKQFIISFLSAAELINLTLPAERHAIKLLKQSRQLIKPGTVTIPDTLFFESDKPTVLLQSH
jgi:hypothetical protein